MGYAVALTTIDNPFDPIDDFIQWFMYDESNGYGTCSYLARIAKTSAALSDSENTDELERAIDEILKNDLTGLYVKIKRQLNELNETEEEES